MSTNKISSCSRKNCKFWKNFCSHIWKLRENRASKRSVIWVHSTSHEQMKKRPGNLFIFREEQFKIMKRSKLGVHRCCRNGQSECVLENRFSSTAIEQKYNTHCREGLKIDMSQKLVIEDQGWRKVDTSLKEPTCSLVFRNEHWWFQTLRKVFIYRKPKTVGYCFQFR